MGGRESLLGLWTCHLTRPAPNRIRRRTPDIIARSHVPTPFLSRPLVQDVPCVLHLPRQCRAEAMPRLRDVTVRETAGDSRYAVPAYLVLQGMSRHQAAGGRVEEQPRHVPWFVAPYTGNRARRISPGGVLAPRPPCCGWEHGRRRGLRGLGRSEKGAIIRPTSLMQRETHSSSETSDLARKGAACVRITASHADTCWGWRWQSGAWR